MVAERQVEIERQLITSERPIDRDRHRDTDEGTENYERDCDRETE